jgi:hypothetical protein
MPERKKRTYTFRKGEVIPYESGSIIHEDVKALKQASRDLWGFEPQGTRKKRPKHPLEF